MDQIDQHLLQTHRIGPQLGEILRTLHAKADTASFGLHLHAGRRGIQQITRGRTCQSQLNLARFDTGEIEQFLGHLRESIHLLDHLIQELRSCLPIRKRAILQGLREGSQRGQRRA